MVAAINSGTSATTTLSSPQRRRTIQNKHQSIEQVDNSNNNYDPYIGLNNKQSNRHRRELQSSMSMGMIEEEVTDNVPSDQTTETEIPPDNNTEDEEGWQFHQVMHDTTNAPKCTSTLISRHPTCKTCLYACGEVTTKSCAFGEAGTCNFDCASFGDSFVEKQYCVVPQEDSMEGADMENMSNDTMSSAAGVYKMGVSVVVLALSIGYAMM